MLLSDVFLRLVFTCCVVLMSVVWLCNCGVTCQTGNKRLSWAQLWILVEILFFSFSFPFWPDAFKELAAASHLPPANPLLPACVDDLKMAMTEGEMLQYHQVVKLSPKKGRRRGFLRKGLASEPHLRPCDPNDSHDCRQVDGVTLTGASEAKTPRQVAGQQGPVSCTAVEENRLRESKIPAVLWLGLVRRCTRLFAYLRGADLCLTSLQVWRQCIISLFTSFLHGGGRAYSRSGRRTLLKFPQQIASRAVLQSHVQPCSLHHNSSGGGDHYLQWTMHSVHHNNFY